MTKINPHLQTHFSLADMVSLHIRHWREALTDQLMIKAAPDDQDFINHELKALDDIEQACAFELNQAHAHRNTGSSKQQFAVVSVLLPEQQSAWDEFIAEVGTAQSMQDVHTLVGRAEGYARCWLDHELITAVAHSDLTVQLSSAAVSRTTELKGLAKL
jgi:hypothetical protein